MARAAKKAVTSPRVTGEKVLQDIADAMPPIKPTIENARHHLSNMSQGDVLGDYEVEFKSYDERDEYEVLILKHTPTGRMFKFISYYSSFSDSFNFTFDREVTAKKIEKIIYE